MLDFRQAAGAMHRLHMGIEIGFHDPAFAEASDSVFIIAGVVLLWMNLRASRRNRFNVTSEKPGEQSEPDQFQN
ncbi:hypothetical protein [Bradyrhizobium sp. RDM4]|uniref:hypothetical protein n=1 Tax=Bradyrhizobium sp. RDM4 TaxID=3378765 RepID=UPI0038FC8CA7